MPPLKNIKHEKFAVNYVAEGLSGKDAAIKAGFSVKSAASTSTTLLKHPKVKQRIRELIESTLGDQHELKYKVLMELQSIAFSNPEDYVVKTGKGDGQFYLDITNLDRAKMAALESIQTEVCHDPSSEEESGGYLQKTRIKTHSKVKALEILCKYLGLLTDTHVTLDVEFKVTAPPKPEDVT